MTVSTTTSRVAYTGNGATTAFTVPFYFLANGDLKVYQAGTLKTITTHYTVSGTGNPAGGTVTFVTAPANGDAVVIFRDPALTQSTDYTPNDPFPAESHEQALDRLTMIAQRNRDLLDRAFVLSDGLAGTIDTTLPDPQAQYLVGWNATADALVNYNANSLAGSVTTIDWITEVFSGDGSTVQFALSRDPGAASNCDVSISGVSQVAGVDYTTTATAITFTSAPPSGTDNIAVRYGAAAAAGTSTAEATSYLPASGGLTDVQTRLRSYEGSGGASYIGYLPAGTGAVATDVQTKLREVVSVFDFMTPTQIAAVKNNTVLDVTSAVQAAINYIETVRTGRLVFPAGDYRVTQITLGSSGVRLGTTYEFQNANIVGIAAVPTKSIVQIKCGSATILNMAVAGGQSTNYECGVHWYTNDLNTYYPGLNRIDGMLISGCVIGLMIGALPSQADPIPAQGAVVADGLATDAPVSECYVGGLRTQDCITGVYMRQPNGKLTFTSPTLTTSNAAWPGTGVSAEANCNALIVYGSELTVMGGFIENIDDAAGALAWAQSSTLNIIGTTLEGKSAIWIGGRSTLNMSQIQNWGMNNDSMSFFRVKDDAEGCLNLSDMFLRRGYGTSSTTTPIKAVSNLASGAGSVNGKFWVNATNVEFGDCNFTQGSTYSPLVFGCKSKFKNCWATTHSAVDPYPTTVSLKLDEGTNLLAGKVDLAADVITAYAANAGATSGGWVFSNPSGSSWGSTATSLPTIEGLTPHNALRLTAAGGGTVSATSPKFAVEPQRTYLIKGWMRTNATGSQNIIGLLWYDFSGAAASTAQTYSIQSTAGATGPAGTTWSPFMLWAQAPKDATQAEVFLYSENGSELWTVALEVV
jgi:hypothetical protein